MRIIEQSYEILSPVDGLQMLKNIELAGRVSYKSEDKITDDSAKAFVKVRILTGHESILEHEKITVRFICDRGVSHALVRHRHTNVTQESTIYCNYSKDKFNGEVTFISCDNYLSSDQAFIWRSAMLNAEVHYLTLIKAGCQPSVARGVLPTSVKTEMVFTANLREWRSIFKQRTPGKGDSPLMAELMRSLCDEFKQLIPVIFDDIKY